MKIYNTLTKKIEDFVSIEKDRVKMYTCGPTVYNFAHIGNLRTYIFEDILEKTLEYVGYNVERVMNITDVGHLEDDSDVGEDKMELSSKRENKTVYEIAEFYTNAFLDDMEKLNLKKPDIISKASDNISEYIKMIEVLLEKGYAYISNDNVYFDITKSNNYYELSGKSDNDLIVAVRSDVTEDENKKNPFDFVLWFTNSKFENHIMKWDSPWGSGYPGWHIECSCIALKYLGEKIDIHCGGVDNIFPHHTNEIVQSEAYLGHKWCNYWVHGEWLIDKTGKISKSKGEFLTISLLEEKGYNPLAYKFMCLQSHYRNQLVFSYESLDIASNSYSKLKTRIDSLNQTETLLNEEVTKNYKIKFSNSLEDDLNTSNSITCVFDVLKDKNLTDYNKLYLIEDFDKVLGLKLINNRNFNKMDINLIEELVEKRNVAKNNKDYETSDKIRQQLYDMGIILKDNKDKTTYDVRR